MTVTTTHSLDWSAVRDNLLERRGARKMPPWVKLPALSDSLMKCLQLSRDPDVCVADLATVIESDAGLTCQLLRFANSTTFATRRKAATAGEAVARLGVRNTCLFLTTDGVREALKGSQSKLLNFNAFWCNNLERALIAKHVARAIGADEDVAFAAGMLADCLLPVVTNAASRTYMKFIEDRKTYSSLPAFEQKEFGWDHTLATASIFDDWGFPPEVVCGVFLHHLGEKVLANQMFGGTFVAAVAVAGLAPDQIHQERDGLERFRTVVDENLSLDLGELVATIDEEFAELSPNLKNPFPLSRLLSRR